MSPSKQTRTTVTRLRKLLKTGEPGPVHQAIQLVASLQDPEVHRALLAGYEGVDERAALPRPFAGPVKTAELRRLACILTLASSPVHEEERAAVTRLEGLRGEEADLSLLAGFPNLVFLECSHHSRMDLRALPVLAHLKLLSVDRVVLADLPPTLTVVHLLGSWRRDADVDLCGAAEALPRLEELVLGRHKKVDLTGLQNAALRVLTLSSAHSGEPLNTLRSLEQLKVKTDRLMLSGLPLTDLDVVADEVELSTLPHLKRLRVRAKTLRSAPQKGVRDMEIWVENPPPLCQTFPNVVDADLGCTPLKSLSGAEHLEQLRVHEMDGVGLSDLPALKALHLSRFEFRSLPRLTPPVELTHQNARVIELFIVGPPFPDLRGLGSFAIQKLTIKRFLSSKSALTSLRGVEECRSLTHLSISGSPNLTDVAAAAALPHLVWLDLRGCSNVVDLSALEAAPDLRVIAIEGTGVDPNSLSPLLRKLVSTARKPSPELAGRARPTLPTNRPKAPKRKKIPVPESEREAWEAWNEALIRARSTGVEALKQVQEAYPSSAVADVLLKGCGFEGGNLVIRGRLSKLPVEGREVWTRGLIAAHPHAKESQRLTSSPTLKIERTKSGANSDGDLLHLGVFSENVTSALFKARQFQNLAAIGELQRLESLSIDVQRLPDLKIFGHLPALKKLTVWNWLDGVAGIENFPALLHGDFNGVDDLSVLAHPGLQTLTASRVKRGFEGLTRIPSLQALSASSLPASWVEKLPPTLFELTTYEDWGALSAVEHPGVRRLYLARLSALDDCSGLPALRCLTLQGETRTLRGLPDLDYLALGRDVLSALRDVPPVKIKHLRLMIPPGKTVDLSSLRNLEVGVFEIDSLSRLHPKQLRALPLRVLYVPGSDDLQQLHDHPTLQRILTPDQKWLSGIGPLMVEQVARISL